MDVTEQLQQLLDRQAIADCLQRNARGQDRHDLELMASSYHPDAIDDHGDYVGPGQAYGERANAAHQAFTCHQHHLTTQSVDLFGDTAHAETYYLAILRAESGAVVLASGRYIDRLERRDGEWRLSNRVVTVESRSNLPDAENDDRDPVFYPGTQDRTDLSYQRPLRPPRTSVEDRYPARPPT
jgi:hypothetical protein